MTAHLAPQREYLTEQDLRFVELLFKGTPKLRAAQAAYGSTSMMAGARAAEVALSRPAIRKALADLGRPVLEAQQITADRVMMQLARHAFADRRRVYDEDGKLVLPHELEDDLGSAVAGFKETIKDSGEIVREYRFVDPTAALTSLAKHFKIIGDVGEGFDSLAAELAARLGAARKRVEVTDRGVGSGGIAGFVEGGSTPVVGYTPENCVQDFSILDAPAKNSRVSEPAKRKPGRPRKNPETATSEPASPKRRYTKRAAPATVPPGSAEPTPQEGNDDEQLW